MSVLPTCVLLCSARNAASSASTFLRSASSSSIFSFFAASFLARSAWIVFGHFFERSMDAVWRVAFCNGGNQPKSKVIYISIPTIVFLPFL